MGVISVYEFFIEPSLSFDLGLIVVTMCILVRRALILSVGGISAVCWSGHIFWYYDVNELWLQCTAMLCGARLSTSVAYGIGCCGSRRGTVPLRLITDEFFS